MPYTVLYSGPGGARWGQPPAGGQDVPIARLRLLPRERRQTLLGFGGAFTEAAAYVFSLLPEPAQEEFLGAYFDPGQGLGYTLGRVSIHSSDFSLCSYVYTAPGDEELASFTLAHEQKWLFPLLRRAMRRGKGLALLASPWSPPPWLKTNGSMLQGGALREGAQDKWAAYIDRYLSEMKAQGLPVGYLSVQNEAEAVQPWESCVYTPAQEAAFVADFLGPRLAQHHPEVKLLGWDHNRDKILPRADELYGGRAARYLWGLGFHWYVCDEHRNLTAVHNAWPQKHLLFTEGCLEGGPQPHGWQPAVRYARDYLQNLNHWCEGFFDWNLLLDWQGGPNHVGNYCHAPILADTAAGRIHKNSAYYAIGHFSRFLKPGAYCLGLENPTPLLAAAAQNPDGSLACVLLNPTDKPMRAQLSLSPGQSVELLLEGEGLATVHFTA